MYYSRDGLITGGLVNYRRGWLIRGGLLYYLGLFSLPTNFNSIPYLYNEDYQEPMTTSSSLTNFIDLESRIT